MLAEPVRQPPQHHPGPLLGRRGVAVHPGQGHGRVPLGLPGRGHDGHNVIEQVTGDLHALERLPHGQHPVRGGDRLELGVLGGPLHPALEHGRLVAGGQVAQAQPHQEPVELGLGQLVGALVLDGVVRGQDDERLGQPACLPVHAHLALAHRLKQRRLGFRRCPVDLVGEQQLGEHRPGPEHHVGRPLVIERGADHVGGQQVRGELNAAAAVTTATTESPAHPAMT